MRGRYADYIEFKEDVQEDITDPYQDQLDRLAVENERNKADLSADLIQLRDNRDLQIERAERTVQQNEENQKIMAALTGVTFSTRGSQAMASFMRDNKMVIENMYRNRDRAINDIITQQERLMEDFMYNQNIIQDAMESKITETKINFFNQVNEIQNKFGEYSEESLSKIQDIQKNFATQLENLENKAFERTKFQRDTIMDQYSILQDQQEMEMSMRNQNFERTNDSLINTSMSDIVTMVNNGQLNYQDVPMLRNNMLQTAIDAMNNIEITDGMALGSLNAKLLQQFMFENGMTPAQAVETALKSP